jgi:flagellar biosynthesis/type III secretory pathway M-ring protein FliF/YscJ
MDRNMTAPAPLRQSHVCPRGNLLGAGPFPSSAGEQTKDGMMADERIVEVERPSGGGAGWMIAMILLVALVLGILLFANMSNSSARKDNAIAAAAGDVGKAATKAGDAAQNAADKAAPSN